MKRSVLMHCVAPLLAVQALVFGLPTATGAPRSSVISGESQKHILSEPGVPILGSAHADVTVVEYFDYNCPFCRALAPTLRTFIDQDHAAAILYKEWPIFGGASIYAAQAALAAGYQGKYLQAHDALIGAPRLEKDTQVDAVLGGAGIDMAQLKRDLESHRASIEELLKRNDAEARGLGLHGTPGILVGRRIVHGIEDLHALQSAVALARHPAVKH